MRTVKINGSELLLPEQVAGVFQVDTKTVARWAKAGKLHPIRTPGGHRRYFAAEVYALLEGRTLTPEQINGLRQRVFREAVRS